MPNVLAKHFPQKVKHSTFHPLPHVKIPLASRRFPPSNPASRGHGRRSPAHPPLPWPRWAARRRKRGLAGLRSAAVWRLGSRRPRAPKPAGRTPTERKGRKIPRKFWHLKSGSFGNCGHSNSSLNLRNIVVLRCLEAIEFLEKTVAFAILVKMAYDKLKNAPTLENISTRNWDTSQFENSPQSPRPVSLLLVFHVRGRT